MTGIDLLLGQDDFGNTQHSLGAREKGNPRSPGVARAERVGGSENWEWPGSKGEGRPRAAGVRVTASSLSPCEGVEER